MRTAADLADGIRDLIIQGREAWHRRDYVCARARFAAALRRAETSGDTFGEMTAHHFLGNVAFNEQRDGESREHHARALALARSEHDEQGIATSLGSLALIELAADNRAGAARLYESAIVAYRRAGMEAAADSLRHGADALLSGRTTLAEAVDRVER